MFRNFLGSVVLSLICSALYGEDWLPVYEEPRHKLAFENDHAMILNVNLPPGYVSLYHEHKIDLLYVTIVGTKVWAEPLGGQRREADVKTGDFLRQAGGESHGYENAGDNEITIIEMLWR